MIIEAVALSDLLNDVEDSDHTVAATASEHVARVAEVDREAGSAKVLDLGAWLEHLLAIEDLDLIGAGTSGDDQIARILLELRLVDHAGLLRR